MKNNNYKKQLTKEEKFEIMLQKFLKESKKKQLEINIEHTKSSKKKKKANDAERRKIALKKKFDK